MLISGLINCYKGWILYADPFSINIYSGGLAAVCGSFVVLEIWDWLFKNRRIVFRKLKEMTHLEAKKLEKFYQEVMFADELVINVKHFMMSHPGGMYLINSCLGEDSGKYMVGCSSYGGSLNQYTHSVKAFSYISSLAIAKIPYTR